MGGVQHPPIARNHRDQGPRSLAHPTPPIARQPIETRTPAPPTSRRSNTPYCSTTHRDAWKMATPCLPTIARQPSRQNRQDHSLAVLASPIARQPIETSPGLELGRQRRDPSAEPTPYCSKSSRPQATRSTGANHSNSKCPLYCSKSSRRTPGPEKSSAIVGVHHFPNFSMTFWRSRLSSIESESPLWRYAHPSSLES